jgi:hypothetical protein
VGLMLGRTNQRHASSTRVLKPQARTDELVIEEVGDELLIYDSANKRAHCLGPAAAAVWRACDGNGSVDALSDTLDLSADEVKRVLDELEALELLERTGLEILQSGSDEGSGITRRQLTMRTVKAGAAVAVAPIAYSINVSPALATLTPIPFQCEVYTVQSCGTSDACGHVAGCCCCCQGGGACKTCGATAFCNAGTQNCSPVQGGGTGTHCSSVGSTPADPRGCCGVTGAKQCGCGFGPNAGCCNQNTGTSCTPSVTDTNCFPCCNGELLTSAAPLGCCTSVHENCCSANPPACCQKSTLKTDCCGPNPPACCATNTCP